MSDNNNGGNDGSDDKNKGKEPIQLIVGGRKKSKIEAQIEEAFVDAFVIKPATNGGYVLTVTYTDFGPEDTYIMQSKSDLLDLLNDALK
jgi:uncharacterized protein Veg